MKWSTFSIFISLMSCAVHIMFIMDTKRFVENVTLFVYTNLSLLHMPFLLLDKYWLEANLVLSSCWLHLNVYFLYYLVICNRSFLCFHYVLQLWTLLHTFGFCSLFAFFICWHSTIIPHHCHSSTQQQSTIVPKVGSGFDVCGGCHKSCKRLYTYIAQNVSCANHVQNIIPTGCTACCQVPLQRTVIQQQARHQHVLLQSINIFHLLLDKERPLPMRRNS